MTIFGASAIDSPADDAAGVPIPADDFVVTGNVKIKPGAYRIADANGDGVIHVRGDRTNLDLAGVTLIGAADEALPDSFVGVGVSIDGAKDVTITGGAVRGFKIGLRAHDAPAVRLAGVDASGNFKQHLKSTVDREDASDWLFGHENDDGHWERDYGAGIALKNCVGATVEKSVVRGGQNGVLLDRCDKARVFDGDFSFNSGWGVALWRTCDAVISENRADFCVRGYSHGRYARGQDSAGFLVFEQSSRNKFDANSATHGGDGFFLYAGNETLKKTGEGGCNDNDVRGCDFSFAVANGIEATFSRGNRFLENGLNHCEHGVWAGYSFDTQISINQISHCVNGVSIEHGRSNRISGNDITGCRVGVQLWSDLDAELAGSAFGRKHDARSSGSKITGNRFAGNGTDIRLADDQNSGARENEFKQEPKIVREGDTTGAEVDLKSVSGGITCFTGFYFPRVPKFRDRKYILVDDWGPVPPDETRLFPARQDAVGPAKLSLLGVDKKFEILSLTDGFVAEPMKGDLPAVVTVRQAAGRLLPRPFKISVALGDDIRQAEGTVASMPWEVRFFQWTKDPREDADAWKALLAGAPVETRRVDGLDFDWKSAAVSEAVGADHFGTLATGDVQTTAGRWTLRTLSDDGIRVWVDGKLVIDDWTHHGPTPHDVELDLSAGKHAIRVEHFEIDGWAVLRASLSPK